MLHCFVFIKVRVSADIELALIGMESRFASDVIADDLLYRRLVCNRHMERANATAALD